MALTLAKYYIHTKETMPMDVEFVVKDAYELIRPQWKLASTLEEAGALFAEAVRTNYKTTAADKAAEAAEADAVEDDEDDEADMEGRRTPAEMEDKSTDDEVLYRASQTRKQLTKCV